jgi:hypothetical protein
MTKSCRTINRPSLEILPNFLCKYSYSSGNSLGRFPVEQQKNITMNLFWFIRLEGIFLILKEQVLD